MSIELIIYLVSMLENVCFLKALAAMGVVGSAMFYIIISGWAQVDDDDIQLKKLHTFTTKTFKWSALFLVLSAFIPTQKTAYLMLGAHFGKEVIQSETASKVQRIIDGKLDQYLKELEK